MEKDSIGMALSAANKLAGSSLVNKLKLRKPAEKLAYLSTRTGFQVFSSANESYKQVKRLWQSTQSGPTTKSPLFDLSLSEEQKLIQGSLKRFSEEMLRPLAANCETAGVPSVEILDKAIELGIVDYVIPETFGGYASESSVVTSCLMAETMAWGDMGLTISILSTLGAANAINRWGTDEQKAQCLPSFCSPSGLISTIAVNEPYALFNPQQLRTTAELTPDGYRLNGIKTAVPMAENSTFFLVAARLPDGQNQVFMVSRELKGITIKPDPSMGLRSAHLSLIEFQNVELSKRTLLGKDRLDYSAFLDFASLQWCSLAVGCGQAILDYVIQYCNERTAFGEPISHRQSVAFMVADMGIELEAMHLLTLRAAALADQGQDFHQSAYLARIFCSDKAMEIGTNGVQLLGGHGFIKEHPVERWYRDMRSIALMHGGCHA
jgi:alkylation response protein AidB-like acyl-CoA dehydrogenase